MLTIELPFPDPRLSPNRKNGKHWTATKDVKHTAWEVAYVLTHNAVNKHRGEWHDLTGDVPLTLTFCCPDNRHRDLDNLLASEKSAIDGIATALTINDTRFNPVTIKRGEVRKMGAVIVEIGVCAASSAGGV